MGLIKRTVRASTLGIVGDSPKTKLRKAQAVEAEANANAAAANAKTNAKAVDAQSKARAKEADAAARLSKANASRAEAEAKLADAQRKAANMTARQPAPYAPAPTYISPQAPTVYTPPLASAPYRRQSCNPLLQGLHHHLRRHPQVGTRTRIIRRRCGGSTACSGPNT